MSMFFLISGFIFGIAENKTKYCLTKCCTELKEYSSADGLTHYNARNFYQRRIARILPLFYLTNIFAIPLQYGGYGWFDPDSWQYYVVYPLTLTATTTWFGIVLVLNGPSWFVSTMTF